MSECRIRNVMLLAVLGIAVYVTAIGAPRPTVTGAMPMSPMMTNLSGQQLYALACASCHGLTGQGRVFNKEGQKIEVPAITYGELAKMYTKNFDSQARTAIVQGLDEEGKALNPMMPRWTMLSPADVNRIIAYIKTLK